MLKIPSTSSATYNSLQILSDRLVFNLESDDPVYLIIIFLSGSILPHSEPGIEPEPIANTNSEGVRKFAHPDDVAAMQAEYVVLPHSKHRLELTAFVRLAQAIAEAEFLKAQQGYVPPQPSVHHGSIIF
jgi:hypothetical protein